MKSNKDEIDFIRENRLLNQLPTRELITNIPFAVSILKHDRILIVYIKFFLESDRNIKANKNNNINESILKKYRRLTDTSRIQINTIKNEISQYLQFWSYRAEIMELRQGIYAILALSELEEYFLIQLKQLFNFYQQFFPRLHILLDSTILSGKSSNRNRIPYPLIGPNLKTFNKKTGIFEIALPAKRQIMNDLNIFDLKKPAQRQLHRTSSHNKHIFLKHGKPIISIDPATVKHNLQEINDENAQLIYDYLCLHGNTEGLTLDELITGVNLKKTTIHDALQRLMVYNLVIKKQGTNNITIKNGRGLGRPKIYYFAITNSIS